MEKPEPEVKKTFPRISPEDMRTKYKNDVFWYVFDQTNQMIIANPLDKDMESFTYLFQEREDAQKWGYLISKSPAYQDLKLSIDGSKVQDMLADADDTFGEFEIAGITHEQAKLLFENYEYYLLFYGYKREDDEDIRTDD
jgi:hypothetical protein